MLDEWLDATARASEPAVRFSSCFPFLNRTLYVVPPRSVWPPAATPKVRWKGARFVPLSVVEMLLKGQNISEESWSVDGASEALVPQGAPALFRVSVRTSAAVDRQGASVAPHSSACIEFAPGAGLWMLARFADDQSREKWKQPVSAALRLLGDSGFGGERSQGWGRADVEIADHDTRLLSTNGGGGESGWWVLSLFHPAESDHVDWRKGNYAITTRGGRIESEARWGEAKRPSRMVTEGSVIVSDEEPRGSATDVAPEGFPHPVYRAGYALSIRVPFSSRAETRLQTESFPHIEPPEQKVSPVESPDLQEPADDVDTSPRPEEAGE